VENINDPGERQRLIDEKREEMAKKASSDINSVEAHVSEMFAGQSYVLFKYRIIKDIRLVFAPPRSIGEFGGESDNWVWPRHTGDFSFMRAYVAPDGSAAEYSEDNVPYQPKKFLKVNTKGVSDGDFVFLLGYPAATYRHNPSQFMEFQQLYELPYISNLYEWIINKLEMIGSEDPEYKLKTQSRMKSLANTMKNYRGQLKGLLKLNLLEKKKAEDKLLQQMIEKDSKLYNLYSNLFDEIEQGYQKQFEYGQADLWLWQLFRQSSLISLAGFVWDNAEQAELIDSLRETAFKEENLHRTIAEMDKYINNYNQNFEESFLAKMIGDADLMNETSRIRIIDSLFESVLIDQSIEEYTRQKLIGSSLQDKDFFLDLCTKSVDELKNLDNPLLNLVYEIRKQDKDIIRITSNLNSVMNKLQPQLNELKKHWRKKSYIPDANSTLRLTYGYIKGYSPADAVYYSPITSLEGIIEKSSRGGDYEILPKLRELYEQKDYGNYYSSDVDGLPVGILYDTDTAGGNSGSPILDAYGNLVGVNFDRAYEATINDFAWDDSYSRSIGVDIRYILWITQKIGGADSLIAEIGVNL
jgi:hypothetical protein